MRFFVPKNTFFFVVTCKYRRPNCVCSTSLFDGTHSEAYVQPRMVEGIADGYVPCDRHVLPMDDERSEHDVDSLDEDEVADENAKEHVEENPTEKEVPEHDTEKVPVTVDEPTPQPIEQLSIYIPLKPTIKVSDHLIFINK